MDLKLEQIVGVLIRCFAINLFVVVILFQAQLFLMAASYGGPGPMSRSDFLSYLYSVLSTAVELGIIIFLWQKPLLIAKKLIPLGEGQTVRLNLTFEELQTLCFTVIGFWIAVNGCLRSIEDVVHIIVSNGAFKMELDYTRGAIGLVQFLIGLSVAISAKGYSKILTRLRN